MDAQNKKMNITYLGGAWPTNIGNAFIDLGSMHSLKSASPGCNIRFYSEVPQWFFYYNKKNVNNAIGLARLVKSDYLVVSGMLCCDEFIKLYEPVISELIKNGTKFIINGGGGAEYTKKEVENFRNFLKRNPPYAFISRDEPSFENFKDLAEHSYSGIDCGFFVSDCFESADLNLPDFVVFNFDTSRTENFLKMARKLVFFKKPTLKIPEIPKIKDRLIIRTHHSCWPVRRYGIFDIGLPRGYFNMPNTFISDIPYGYLNFYAKTKATYSNRVHACVATLAFGNPAMLFSESDRAYLFDRVGASRIKEKLVCLNPEKIRQEKSKQIEFLSSVLK